MSRLYGVTHAVIPLDYGTGVEGVGAFATHVIEAISFAGVFVVERLHKQSRVVSRPAVAGVVYASAVKDFRASGVVEFGQAVKGQHVGDDPGHDVGNGRATLHVDDGFAREDFPNGFGVRRVGVGMLYAARRGAVAPGDDGLGTGRPFFEYRAGIAPGNGAIAGAAERYGSFDHHHIIAVVLAHGFFAQSLGLFACRGHEGVAIFERNHLHEDLAHEGVRSPQERFAATGAFLEVIPQYRFTGFALQGIYHLCHTTGLQPQ